jgi:hypothetical protein
LWRLYKQVKDGINARAQENGLNLHDKPRSYKVFFCRIIAQSRYRFFESVIPRRCNPCDLYERAMERLPDVSRKLAVARSQNILEKNVRYLREKQTLAPAPAEVE